MTLPVWHTEQMPILSALPARVAAVLADSDRANRLSRQFTASFLSQGVEPDADQTSGELLFSAQPVLISSDQWRALSELLSARAIALASLADRLRSLTMAGPVGPVAHSGHSGHPDPAGQPGLVGNAGQRPALPAALLDAVLGTPDAVPIMDRSPGALSAPALVMAAFDVVLEDDGPKLVADRLDAPGGLGEALLVRSITSRAFGAEMAAARVTPYVEHLTRIRQVVSELAPPGRSSPRTVMLARPAGSSGYSETAILATRLGLHLASPADLVVLQHRVWLRTLGGVEPVDVVFRSVDEGDTDPLAQAGGSTAGVTALMQVWRTGEVGLANPLGLRGLEARDEAGARAIDEALASLVAPGHSIERVAYGTVLDGALVMRVHVVLGSNTAGNAGNGSGSSGSGSVGVSGSGSVGVSGSVSVLPGGMATVSMPGQPTVIRDVWVRAGSSRRTAAKGRAEAPVDLAESVPTSAAEALFWAGRNAEQAETSARLLRVLVRIASDAEPSVLAVLSRLSARVTQPRPFPVEASGGAENSASEDELAEAITGLWSRGGAAGSVERSVSLLSMNLLNARSFLPAAAFDVMERIRLSVEASRSADSQQPDTYSLGMRADEVLAGLASLAGLVEETMVRSPARTFLLIGRRIQRLLRTLDLIEPIVALDPFGHEGNVQSLCEAILGSTESLIAYRRRYRTDVVVDRVSALLVHDSSNPRSILFQAQELMQLLQDLPQHSLHDEHVAGAMELLAVLSDQPRWSGPDRLDVLHRTRVLAESLGRSLANDWFAVDLVSTVHGEVVQR